ncbi:MAG: hypothetical protein LCH39_01395 [Proteobacteria bacterium]|nr:hypothetical protein [Pseudomonadota bacterium]
MRRMIIISTLALSLSACGHRPLKAPCEPGDAQPLSSFLGAVLPQVLSALLVDPLGLNACGPMRPL